LSYINLETITIGESYCLQVSERV